MTRTIRGYSSMRQSWVETTSEGDREDSATSYPAAAVLPTGQLVVTSRDGVYRVTLSVTTFDPDSKFISNVLSRVEAVMGIHIVSVLANIHYQLSTTSGVQLQPQVGEYGRRIPLPDPQRAPDHYVEEVISQWSIGHSPHPPTWRELLQVLQDIGQLELRQQIEAFMLGESRYLDAYHQFINSKQSLDMLFLKFLFLGPPRLGKTTTCRRLMGEIVDLKTAGEAEKVQPSTGAVESGSVIVRNVSDTTAVVTQSKWSALKNLEEEACMLFRNLVDCIDNKSHTAPMLDALNKSSPSTKTMGENTPSQLTSPSVAQAGRMEQQLSPALTSPQAFSQETVARFQQDTPVIIAIFQEAMKSQYWKDMKHMFKAYLRVEDTGGQPELMDMLPALTIGPGLYLLFINLQNDLDHHFKLTYCNASGASTPSIESVNTVKEMILSSLSSISCSNASSNVSELDHKEAVIPGVSNILKSSKSVAYIVGTHKDKVTKERVQKMNEELLRVIEATEFSKFVEFFSEDELIITVDNMDGGTEEVKKIQALLEKGMDRHFKELQIPAVWLLFSLILRKKSIRTATLEDCMLLSQSLRMSSYETKVALWFLHHHAGVMMYFPNIPELKDFVILDIQVVYDSVTVLILRAMSFDEVGRKEAQEFKETGKFVLSCIIAVESKVTGDYIPIHKLVALLEFLHILARITALQETSSPTILKEVEVTYIMPCVLKNAITEELDSISKKPHELSPIMVRFKCGFVPIGIFPAMVACLITNKFFILIQDGILKNVVQFRFGSLYTLLTFLCRCTYYEIIVTEFASSKTEPHIEFNAIRMEVESALSKVCSQMNYGAFTDYQFAFECPIHPVNYREHLCVVNRSENIPQMMLCIHNKGNPKPLELTEQYKLWFGELSPIKSSASRISMSSVPTIKTLLLIKWKDINGHLQKLKILQVVSPEWRRLGDMISIMPCRLKAIAKDHREVTECCREVFYEWLEQKDGDYSVSWEGLCELLEDMDLSTLASQIRQIISSL